ncbi:MAG: efflux RND transporter periplasmic adaptor subunit [Planctomycetes bacterium]|nr:efflux RND transporter periplasmic adaptor subunit [Planctomycetota bacterium]
MRGAKASSGSDLGVILRSDVQATRADEHAVIGVHMRGLRTTSPTWLTSTRGSCAHPLGARSEDVIRGGEHHAHPAIVGAHSIAAAIWAFQRLRRRKGGAIRGIVVCVCLACALLDAGEPVPALTVQVCVPVAASWPVTVRADGEIAAWQEAAIASTASGLRITALRADIGDQVRAGQRLADLDTASLVAAIAAQEAAVVQAEAMLATAAADARRVESLRAGGSLTEQQAIQYLNAERSALGQLASARALLEIQQLALERAHVVAPDDGVVIARSAVLGEVVQAGTELFRMIRQDRLEWRAEVVAADLARIRPGQTAQLIIPGGAMVTGTVRSIDPTLAVRTRTAVVRVDLAPGTARAGMFASGDIGAGDPTPALTIPAAAVLVRDGRSLVFTVGGDGMVREQRIVPGRRRDGRIEILDGLAANARVVAAGAAFLTDGDRVAVAP